EPARLALRARGGRDPHALRPRRRDAQDARPDRRHLRRDARAHPPDRVEDDGEAAPPVPFAVAARLPRVSRRVDVPYDENRTRPREVEVDGVRYERLPIKTHVVLPGEPLDPVIEKYALGELRDGDWLFMTEKMVAGSQGRAYPVAEVKARPPAVWLSQRVVRSPWGVGLGIPETMEMAIREGGTVRTPLASR